MKKTLGDIGELAAIERIGKLLPGHRDVVLGAGDDCAIVAPAGIGDHEWLLTSDPVIEGTHFVRGTPCTDVGHKAIGRALSDIAAMGGRPCWALIDIVAPTSMPVVDLDALYHGAARLAALHGLSIIGGDLAEGPVLELHVFAIGDVPVGRAVRRSTARAGDHVFVTGALGGSIAGRHLTITPRIPEGLFLRDWATAMIDVSDGLASDLRHITTLSGVGCQLNAGRIPIAAAAHTLCDGRTPLDHALHDGEDFELLFTIAEDRDEDFEAAWRASSSVACTRIGRMTAEQDLIECVFGNGEALALEGTGFVHFKSHVSRPVPPTT